jgi:hypothetical protein
MARVLVFNSAGLVVISEDSTPVTVAAIVLGYRWAAAHLW